MFKGEEAEELFETNWDLEVDNFDDMGLKEEVLRGIYAFGFKEPSPIQQKGILPIIQSKDTIAQVRICHFLAHTISNRIKLKSIKLT